MNQDLKLFLIWMRRLTQLNFATYNPEIKETTFNYVLCVYVAVAGDTDKRTDVWSRPLCINAQIFNPKKKLFFPQ